MSGTTISTSYLNGVTLSNATADNPVSILAGVTISDATAPALYGTGTIDWTIANAGTVHSNGTTVGSYGIYLTGGGTVTNIAGGIVSGAFAGIAMHSTGTVFNHGSINASNGTYGGGIVLDGGGIVTNGTSASVSGGAQGIALRAVGAVANNGTVQGLTADGVLLNGGGAASNNTASSIIGYQAGVSMAGDGTVVNQGSIGAGQTTGKGYYIGTSTGLTTLFNAGVLLDSGGVSNAITGTISDYFFGVAANGVASVVNQGLITASGTTIGLGVFLPAGGSVSNAASGTISGHLDGVLIGGSSAVTAINQGGINAVARAGIDLFGAGYASNAASGTITGLLGVLLRSTGQAVNAGSIVGTAYGIDLVGLGTATNTAAANITAPVGMFEKAGGTVDNLGTIVATGTTAKGVYLYASGYVSNAATGTISSGSVGIFVTQGSSAASGVGTVTNFGSIISSERYTIGAGIKLKDGGTVINAAGAYVRTQLFGVQIYGNGTVLNQGTIIANDDTKHYGAGVWVKGPADITNASSGTIGNGLFGVVLYKQSTLFNAGVIIGINYAVSATPGYANRIIVVPGASFSGTVSGGNALTSTIASTLELTTGSAIGTITGFGSQFIDLKQVVLDAGASWSLGGTVASAQTVSFGGPATTLTLANPGSMGGLITGFSAHDTIVLAGVTGVTSATLNVANQLSVAPGSGPDLTFSFDPTQTFSGTNFNFVAVGGDTDLTVPCFAAGTRIATPTGEVAVERLRVGDLVLTRHGARRPVAWLGHRRIDCRHHPRPREVWPVRVREGAFGAGAPHRDLLLSPDHAVFIDNVLIPIRYLINDATIVQEPVDGIGYWHLELDRHEVILAEGLACESYLDTGNRGAFANGGAEMHMHADFARRIWKISGCAPLVLHGAELEAARFRLLERAGTLGHATTTDPALRLLVDGRELSGRGNRFRLPAAARHVGLVSRAAVPAHLCHDSNDYRRVGVAVSRILLDGTPIALTNLRLGSGWHDPEQHWRWTDGDAGLEVSGARELRITIAMTGRYWLPAGSTQARHA